MGLARVIAQLVHRPLVAVLKHVVKFVLEPPVDVPEHHAAVGGRRGKLRLWTTEYNSYSVM